MALGRPLGAKLFLEGMEVPFIGATMTHAVGQASIAYIDVVPHKSIMNIKPRTRVEIFVRNYMMTEAEAVGGAAPIPFPYVLAWKGEVFGYNFGKTSTSRTFSLSCIDHSSYWDCCLAYFFNPQQTQSGGVEKAAQAYADSNDAAKAGEKIIPTYLAQASYFKNRIETYLKDHPTEDFMAGVVAMYKEIIGISGFFTYAEERLRIIDQMILKSSGELDKMLSRSEGLEWFTGLVGKNSGYSTLRMILQDLMAILFHDFVVSPFPAATEKTGMTGASLKSNTNKTTISSFIFKPNLYMMPPPACNIFFPDEYSSFQFSRNFFKEPTRLIYMPELPARSGTSPLVYLPHVYMPESFRAYMKTPLGKTLPKSYKGTGSFDIPENVNLGTLKVAGDTSSSSTYKTDDNVVVDYTKVNGGHQSDYNFLTNEEYLKGIWLYRESMMPATTSMRVALDQPIAGSKTAGYKHKTDFATMVAKYLFFKRRFQDRQLQVTSHLKMSVMPGFPVLIVDDSHADQNVMAYCTSVTHRIYATEGGYTNVQLSYARYAFEQDVASQSGAMYLTPPWFDSLIFGPDDAKSEVAKAEVGTLSVQGYPDKLSDFYKTLLGGKGSKALTSLYLGENTVVGATRRLIEEYMEKKKSGTSSDVMDFISQLTARDYIKIKDYYAFFGAKTEVKHVEDENWITFTGGRLNRAGKPDETATDLKKSVIADYVNNLKTARGFRG